MSVSFEAMLESCGKVVAESRHVRINYDRLDDFADDQIDCRDLKCWLMDNPYGILDQGIEDIVNFLFAFESIDYSFWGDPKWSIDTVDGVKDGTDALLFRMLSYARNNGDYSLSRINFNDFATLLDGNVEIPFLRERYETISNNREIVNERMSGNFYKSIYNMRTDRELFGFIVDNFESFRDECEFHGDKVYFYKLAQLLTSEILHLRNSIEKIDVDYSGLLGCADYKIPQTLRALGLISYDAELSKIVDSKEKILPSSDYEVEIRASQITAIDYIKHKLDGARAIDINDFLFSYSKKVKDIARPYHRCRTTKY